LLNQKTYLRNVELLNRKLILVVVHLLSKLQKFTLEDLY